VGLTDGDPTNPGGSSDPGTPEPEADPTGAAPPARHGPPSALARNLVVGPLILMVIGGYVGGALAPKLLSEHPLMLVALNPSNRNLALAGKLLDAPSYYLVGFVRLWLPDPFFYVLGIWYGDAAIRWMERRSPTYGTMFRQLETWFHKARYPIVMFAPNNPVCLFAGASGMSITGFAIADTIGTIGRLWLFRFFGNIFSTPLDAVLRFISHYRLPLMVLSTVIVIATIWSEHRKGRDNIGDLVHIDEEIHEIEAEPDGVPGSGATDPQ
jgi:membrane protein DedA with SNARE-associated domain